MIYLLLGKNVFAKDAKINEIKQKILLNKEALKFDYEVCHATKCDAADLKKALMALPALAKKRVFLIRSAHKLNQQNKDILLGFIQQKLSHLELILDAQAPDLRTKFWGQIARTAKTFEFGAIEEQNVFDVTRAMSRRNPKDALKILSGLLAEGIHPLKIMGGLIWFWGKEKNHLGADKFQEGLKYLKETDLNIKRSRLKPEFALEVLIVNLIQLI